MSSDKTELANESRLAASNPLDAGPDEIPFDVPYGLPISLARDETVVHAAVAANGWRDACLNSDSGTQGPGGRDLPTPIQDLRGRYPADASQLSARVRWSYRVSRWHSTDPRGNASLRSGDLPPKRGSRRSWRAASTSRAMSKIGSDTI